MTATTPASRAISTALSCPSWCEGHVFGGSSHVRDLPGVWGQTGGPVLGLELEREDSENGAGAARVNVQVSRDGVMVDDVVPLGLAAAEDYAVTILRLVANSRAAV